jgi:hypothetical protein
MKPPRNPRQPIAQDQPKFKIGDLVTWKKKYIMNPNRMGPYLVIKVFHRNGFSSGVSYTAVRVITPDVLTIELNGDQIKKI